MNHEVASERKRGRVHTCTCTCGAKFQSINSAGWARMYHRTHADQMRKTS